MRRRTGGGGPRGPVRWVLVMLAVAVAWLGLAGVSVAAESVPGGPAGVLGFLTYHRLDMRGINAALDPGAAKLPEEAYAPGFGALLAIDDRWAVGAAGGEASFEGREPSKPGAVSRLRWSQSGVQVLHAFYRGPAGVLYAGGVVGLAGVQLDLVRSGPGARPGQAVMDRYTRQLLVLEPGVLWHLRLTDAAGVQLGVGYLLGTDFWNSVWAHPSGQTSSFAPSVFTGPVVRLGLMIGMP